MAKSKTRFNRGTVTTKRENDMARLTFHGAVEGVTGSAYLLTTDKSTVLLECGMFQGEREQEKANQEPFPFQVGKLDAVILSHAHLDHSGRLPKLVQHGFSQPIFMTNPTLDLLEVLLKDAASLQQRDVEWENKRRRRAGKKPVEPIYTLDDVERTLPLCKGSGYGKLVEVTPDIKVRFSDAGHILGSAIVEIFISENGAEKKLVFSGDLGNSYAALLSDPEVIESADILLLESTYGDRNHRSMDETLSEFESVIENASESGGNILIPAFAVGRTQEIIFRLGELYQKGKLQHQAVYLDSPMAIAVTEIYHRYQEVYNEQDAAALSQGKSKSLHSFLPVLRYSTTTEESISLNKLASGAIIIAGSGMCNGGRIRHHLKHNLWRPQSHVVFVGYQARGTPGRALVDGVRRFKIGDEKINVKANIHTLGGFSAHASQSQLLDWINHFKEPRPALYLVHGEEKTRQAFAQFLAEAGWSAALPALGETVTF